MPMTVRLHNPPRRRARKRRWTVEEFRAFGERCRRAGRSAKLLGSGARIALWLKTADYDRITDVADALWLSIVYAGDRLAESLGHRGMGFPRGTPADVVALFQYGGFEKVDPPFVCDPHARRGRILTRVEWVTLGEFAKAARDDVSILHCDAANAFAANTPVVKQLKRAERALARAKCVLDSLCLRQHPDWDGFTHVFYGPR